MVGKKRKSDTRQEKAKKKRSNVLEPPQPVLQNEPNQTVQDIWPGTFVALRLAKYDDEIPQLAKVVSVSDMDVTVQWWMGRYRDVWTEWRVKGEVVQETFPRTAVIRSSILLSRSNRLSNALVEELRELYSNIEFI